MRKLNLESRNIFTRRGRLNRRIDKHKKLCEKIGQLEEFLTVLNGRLNNTDENSEECIIRCDGCGYEFDIINKDIEMIECDKTTEDGSPSIARQFICPKCGFKNEVDDLEYEEDAEEDTPEKLDKTIAEALIELDEEKTNFHNNNEALSKLDTGETDIQEQNDKLSENEDLIDANISDNSKVIINEFLDDEMPTKEKIPKKKSKVIEINNKNNKSHKVIINKSNPIKYITDNRIIDAMSIATNHGPTSETIDMLSKKGIKMITASDKHIIGYSTTTGDITLACDKKNKESISIFTITTKLAATPYGNYNYVNNSILSQLNIEKVSEKCEEIGLPGKAYVVKLADNSLAACNFSINQNNITITIIYDIDKD